MPRARARGVQRVFERRSEWMRIAVLGGGVAGLASAHYFARAGHTPLVLEPSGALGQLGSPIVHEGLRIDRFSNSLRNTDTALCGLLADLGGLGRDGLAPDAFGHLDERRVLPGELCERPLAHRGSRAALEPGLHARGHRARVLDAAQALRARPARQARRRVAAARVRTQRVRDLVAAVPRSALR